jgi:hypothetical protein
MARSVSQQMRNTALAATSQPDTIEFKMTGTHLDVTQSLDSVSTDLH